MYFFTVSEAWGPFQCEVPECPECEVFTIRLTDEEYESLPEKTGDEAVRFIFDNQLGVAVCDMHRETPIEETAQAPVVGEVVLDGFEIEGTVPRDRNKV